MSVDNALSSMRNPDEACKTRNKIEEKGQQIVEIQQQFVETMDSIQGVQVGPSALILTGQSYGQTTGIDSDLQFSFKAT